MVPFVIGVLVGSLLCFAILGFLAVAAEEQEEQEKEDLKRKKHIKDS